MAMGGTLFEELGFYYVGPIDGHDLEQLIPVLENVRDAAEGPCLIHVVTQKGKGYAPAEAAEDKYHGVQKFDVVSRSEEHTSELQSLMRISYAVFCLKKTNLHRKHQCTKINNLQKQQYTTNKRPI